MAYRTLEEAAAIAASKHGMANPKTPRAIKAFRKRMLGWVMRMEGYSQNLSLSEAMLLVMLTEKKFNQWKLTECKKGEQRNSGYRLDCLAREMRARQPAIAGELEKALRGKFRRPAGELSLMKTKTKTLEDCVSRLWVAELGEDSRGTIGIWRVMGQKANPDNTARTIMVPMTLADMMTTWIWLDAEARQPVAAIFAKLLLEAGATAGMMESLSKETVLRRLPKRKGGKPLEPPRM